MAPCLFCAIWEGLGKGGLLVNSNDSQISDEKHLARSWDRCGAIAWCAVLFFFRTICHNQHAPGLFIAVKKELLQEKRKRAHLNKYDLF